MIILELKEILKRIHGQKLYYYSDAEELMDKRIECLESLYEFNRTRSYELGKRHALLNEMFALIYSVIKDIIEARLRYKGLPTETEKYLD